MSDDYEIGYGKPPKASQFKPGQSGNPKGRPKGAKNLKTELQEELAERIRIKEGGRQKTVSKQRAILKSLAAKAAQGDTRASNILLNLVLRVLHEEELAPEFVDLTEADLEILEEERI